MLQTILSISGKPGLFRLVSQGKNALIVESLAGGKRMPVSGRDKVVSLGNISMYTVGDDKPLEEILDLVYAHQKGEKMDVAKMDNDALREKFGEILEDFDRERVYPSDIKKLFSWYNILLDAGFTKFTDEEEEAKEEEKEAVAE